MRVLVALALYAVAELLAFVALAEWIGAPWAALILLALSVAGWLMLRSTSRASRVRLAELTQQGSGLRADDGALPVRWAAGLLLLVPGLLSGTAGLILLVPPVSRWAQGHTSRRLLARMAAFSPPGTTIPGEVVRQDRPGPGDRPQLPPA